MTVISPFYVRSIALKKQSGVSGDPLVHSNGFASDKLKISWTTAELKIVGSLEWLIAVHIPLLRMRQVSSNEAVRGHHESLVNLMVEGESDHPLIRSLIAELIAAELCRMHLRQDAELVTSSALDGRSLQMQCLDGHESIVLGLIETLIFHTSIQQALGKCSLDLMDYVYRKVVQLPDAHLRVCQVTNRAAESGKPIDIAAFMDSSERMRLAIGDYQLCMSGLNILRFLVHSRNEGPLSLSKRLFVDYDFPFLVAQLIDRRPWLRTNSATGFLEKWDNQQWVQFTEQLCPTEANCWITILALLDSDEVRSGSYQLTGTRSDALIKLRRHLTESVVMQIPPLGSLKRFLEELNVSSTISAPNLVTNAKRQSPLSAFAIVEVEDRMYESLRQRMPVNIPPLTFEEERIVSSRLCEVLDTLGDIPTSCSDSFKCAVCQKPGEHRCSVCKAVVYCDRKCQTKDWQNHKTICKRI